MWRLLWELPSERADRCSLAKGSPSCLSIQTSNSSREKLYQSTENLYQLGKTSLAEPLEKPLLMKDQFGEYLIGMALEDAIAVDLDAFPGNA